MRCNDYTANETMLTRLFAS